MYQNRLLCHLLHSWNWAREHSLEHISMEGHFVSSMTFPFLGLAFQMPWWNDSSPARTRRRLILANVFCHRSSSWLNNNSCCALSFERFLSSYEKIRSSEIGGWIVFFPIDRSRKKIEIVRRRRRFRSFEIWLNWWIQYKYQVSSTERSYGLNEILGFSAIKELFLYLYISRVSLGREDGIEWMVIGTLPIVDSRLLVRCLRQKKLSIEPSRVTRSSLASSKRGPRLQDIDKSWLVLKRRWGNSLGDSFAHILDLVSTLNAMMPLFHMATLFRSFLENKSLRGLPQKQRPDAVSLPGNWKSHPDAMSLGPTPFACENSLIWLEFHSYRLSLFSENCYVFVVLVATVSHSCQNLPRLEKKVDGVATNDPVDQRISIVLFGGVR